MLIDLLIGLNIKACTNPGREVSSRGRPHDSNPAGVDVPLRSPRPDNPNRSLNILEGIFTFFWNSVTQDKGRNSVLIEPFGNRLHLRCDQIVVSSPGT